MPRDGAVPMPFLKTWRPLLATERGAPEADRLAAAFQEEYRRLLAERGQVRHRGLRKHVHGRIFPLLAAYRVLLGLEGKEAALATCQKLHDATLVGMKRLHERTAAMPIVFPFYRLLVPWMLHFGCPGGGWKIEWVENSRRSVYARIHRCFYQDCLAENGAPELIAVHCQGDEFVFNQFRSPYVEWGRQKLRPQGDAYCDVKFDRRLNEDGAR
jgi:hypothetical protein